MFLKAATENVGRGGQPACGLPSRPRQSELGRRRHQTQVEYQPGVSNTRLETEKKSKKK